MLGRSARTHALQAAASTADRPLSNISVGRLFEFLSGGIESQGFALGSLLTRGHPRNLQSMSMLNVSTDVVAISNPPETTGIKIPRIGLGVFQVRQRLPPRRAVPL